jgi:hypothetical protein
MMAVVPACVQLNVFFAVKASVLPMALKKPEDDHHSFQI